MIQLYIDPGTGSMLFTILIGIVSAGVYSVRVFLMKLRYKTTRNKDNIIEEKVPFVIFSDDKRYWNVFEPICREMQCRGKDILYLTMSEDDPVFNCTYENVRAEYIGNGNKAFARMNLISANVVLSTTPGLDVYQWKRSKQVDWYVHIPHAPSEIVLYRMFGIDYYDAIMVSGDYQEYDIRELEDIRGLSHKEIVKVGIPYMDEMIKRVSDANVISREITTVLLAPSWGKSALFGVYGDEIIKLLVETGYKIIIRPHPQSFVSEKDMIESLMLKYPTSEKLEWNRDVDNFDVLNRSDILISDFSGVVFDFSLIFNKPVIYTNPKFDLSPYDAWWLDKPLWTENALPRLGKQLTDDNINTIKQLIDDCLTDNSYEDGRICVKEETWAHCGEGARIAVDYLIEKYERIITEEKEQ